MVLVPAAKLTLDYPLYACDFDPEDDSRLIVGGGGGAGRSGVGNKITILNTSNPKELVQIGAIDLSKDEDNVTSLAVGRRAGEKKGTLVFAGINSGPKDLEKGKNAHFRVFGIEAASSKSAKGKGKKGEGKDEADKPVATTKLSELSRATLFQHVEKDAYQRITRLSKPFGTSAQLGAVTTGLAKESEIALFETSSLSPPKPKGTLLSNKECVDVDFIQTGEDTYRFVYCDEHDIYLKDLGPDQTEEEPECVYIMPASRGSERPTIPKFRALRILTKELVLCLLNIHSQSGVVLQILRIGQGVNGKLTLAQSTRLPAFVTKATSLAVCNLTPPRTPTEAQGYTQFVVAVGSQDASISLFWVDLQVQIGVSMVNRIQAFKTFKNAHPFNISSIAFSNFTPPKAEDVTIHTPQQVLKLASVGVANTVIVHTIPLFPIPLSVARGQSKSPRYVVALPSTSASRRMAVVLISLGIILLSVLIQGVLEIRGDVAEVLGARNHLPIPFQEALGRPFSFPESYGVLPPIPSVMPLVEKVKSLGGEGETVFVSHSEEGGVEAALHGEGKKGKKWEELGEKEKGKWVERLKEAGEWVEGMGETVLKGVVFGELAGVVGGVVGGA